MTAIRIVTDIKIGEEPRKSPGGSYSAAIFAAVTWQIEDDGTVTEVGRAPGRETVNWNTYLSFAEEPTAPPTEAQRRLLADVWLGNRSILPSAPNHPVCVWAFNGFSPQRISDAYGDGRKIPLA